MPLRPLQTPIVTSPAERQGDLLRQALAPEQWPVKPAWLPEDTAVVGGAVRDALLGRLRERPDLDLVVEGDAVSLARRLAGQGGGSCVVLDAERSIARLVSGGWTIDLAQRCGDSLEADLNRRDYSVNAIALPLSGGAPVDPTGGIPDLAAGQLRAISEANLLEDPLRLLRGLRLACELDFAIEAHTRHWLEQHARQLAEVAGERVLAELERLAAAPSGSAGLAQTIATGLLRVWGGDGPEAMARLQQPAQPLEQAVCQPLPQGLSALVDQALAASPQDRPASAQAMAKALEEIRDHQGSVCDWQACWQAHRQPSKHAEPQSTRTSTDTQAELTTLPLGVRPPPAQREP